GQLGPASLLGRHRRSRRPWQPQGAPSPAGGHAAAEYLAERLRTADVRPGGVDGGFFQDFGDGYRNVLAVLSGRDPKAKKEFVIVGAHFDHVGYGTWRNSRGPIGYVHNGADDNASGVAGLLEVIEAFDVLGIRPRRSILFAFWDAEEKGLLGSEHWLQSPTVPLERVRLVITADMIGRLRDQTLTVFGTRTGAGLRRFVSEQNRGINLRLVFPWDMKRDSDHYAFFEYRLPSLLLHTGLHDDYHRPSDDVERLNLGGMETIGRLLFRLVWAAADADALPLFREDSFQENSAWQDQVEAVPEPPPDRLGVRCKQERAPDGSVEVAEVIPGSPAEQAGLLPGDRIVRFAGRPVARYPDFRTLLVTAPSPAELVVHRPEREMPLHLRVELLGEPLRVGIVWRTDEAEPRSVILSQVVPGSPADLAGLQPRDRIYRVSGRDFQPDEFFKLVTETPSPLQLLIERDGRIRSVRVPLLPDLRRDDAL
ncbi:MAG TPA: M20/M25/M40 family metallo-hydrolase, partial [Planctomycetaceae bacterium]|nr:M20/M25/M40 family metallo-hydrolase [Planctomycetaceae bacterium]